MGKGTQLDGMECERADREQMDRAMRLEKVRAGQQRPGLSETADRMHRAMAELAEQLGELEATLRPVLQETNLPATPRMVEDPDTRAGQSEVHGIVRQWLDQAQSMAEHLRDLRVRVDL